MKKILLRILLVFGLFMAIISISLFDDPYTTIRKSGTDDFIGGITYLKIYRIAFSDARFAKLVTKLINDNMDVRTINLVSLYCKNEEMLQFSELFQQKCLQMKDYPQDSVWEVNITPTYTRKSSREQLDKSNCFCNYW